MKKSGNETANKEKVKSYHDRRHRAKEHKFNVKEAVLLKCDKKHEGDTPFERYIYIASLRKHPFLLALRRWGRFARRNVCDLATEIPY